MFVCVVNSYLIVITFNAVSLFCVFVVAVYVGIVHYSSVCYACQNILYCIVIFSIYKRFFFTVPVFCGIVYILPVCVLLFFSL